MIEIKIPTSAAVILLTERMRYELKMRKQIGDHPNEADLNELDFEELISIAETAAFDLVSLLPADILIEQNNLADIIYKSIQMLSKVYGYVEFKNYTSGDAKRLIGPLTTIFKYADNQKSFLTN